MSAPWPTVGSNYLVGLRLAACRKGSQDTAVGEKQSLSSVDASLAESYSRLHTPLIEPDVQSDASGSRRKCHEIAHGKLRVRAVGETRAAGTDVTAQAQQEPRSTSPIRSDRSRASKRDCS